MSQARLLAAKILNRIQESRQTLDQVMDQAAPEINPLPRADRSLVQALVFGVLRWQSRLDWIIDQFSAKNKKIDPLVRVILRLGLFQLQYLHRIPSSAAVHTSVELAKLCDRRWAAGFVNALLRRAIRQSGDLQWPDASRDPAAHLAVIQAFPLWLISRWRTRWGPETTARICEAINAVPPITLRTNTLRVSRQTLRAAISSEAEEVQETRFSPDGLCLSRLHSSLPQWRSFQEGWFQVQSEAAQLVSRLLSPRPCECVWDVCAGLGTKTAHLAQLMNNQGQIIATDLYADKLDRLNSEMNRLGINIVQTVRCDLTRPAPVFGPRPFDRILVDAPCSGLGVLQKNPDGKWRVKPEDIQANSQRQLALLDQCAGHLKRGGMLVYAVCSLEPEENQAVVAGFLKNHPEFSIHHARLEGVAESDRLLTAQGFFITIPHQHQMDGFFAAALVKKGTG